MVCFNFYINFDNFTKKEKMKYTLKSGKNKKYEEMTKEEKEEVENGVIKGMILGGLIIGGMRLLKK